MKNQFFVAKISHNIACNAIANSQTISVHETFEQASKEANTLHGKDASDFSRAMLHGYFVHNGKDIL